MNGKVIAIVAVAAVVVLVGAGAAAMVLMNDDKGKSSDYTLLDSTTAKEGLYYELESVEGEYSVLSSHKITHVYEDGTLDVNTRDKTHSCETQEMLLLGFTSEFFDVEGDIPSGIEVSKKDVDAGCEYTVKGTFVQESKGEYYNTKTTMEFKDVVFTIDPTSKVVSASGEATKDYSQTHVESPDSIYTKNSKVWKMSTKDSTGMVEITRDVDTKDFDKFYSFDNFKTVFAAYSADTYKACEDKTESARYGGVDCTKHTLNGTTTALEVYKNVDLYVYGNYIIHGEGEVNGLNSTLNVKIYID